MKPGYLITNLVRFDNKQSLQISTVKMFTQSLIWLSSSVILSFAVHLSRQFEISRRSVGYRVPEQIHLTYAGKNNGNNKRSGGEVVTSPPLNRKVGCTRPTMSRARCLRVKQQYPAQKNNQKIACRS